MKKARIATIAVSLCLLTAVSAVGLVGCGGGGSSENSSDPKALYENKCGTCHSLSTVENAPYTTVDEWIADVKKMQAKTSKISDDDAAKITEYLVNRK
ncbi:MAG: cytochrome c [Raoultibacter sp.]